MDRRATIAGKEEEWGLMTGLDIPIATRHGIGKIHLTDLELATGPLEDVVRRAILATDHDDLTELRAYLTRCPDGPIWDTRTWREDIDG